MEMRGCFACITFNAACTRWRAHGVAACTVHGAGRGSVVGLMLLASIALLAA